jgi:AP-3 complex subunit beta
VLLFLRRDADPRAFVSQSDASKLQLLTLSAKLLVLSHLSPLTPHLRTLSLLFTYLTTLARYDLIYEVRDRARFLKGLVAAAGIGQGQATAKMGLGEEEFRRGVQVEEYDGGAGAAEKVEEEEVRSLTGEQVRKVLFEGKLMEDSSGEPSSC